MPTLWRLLFFLQIFSTFSFSFSRLITRNPHPQIPCKPPHHNSYTFCNTSLPISIRAQSLISLLTLDEKITLLSNHALPIPRVGIPAYEWWSESLHGMSTTGPGVTFNGPIPSATSFPQVLLTTASFNSSLWFMIASAIAVEARAMYNVGQAGLTYWAPNVNIFRDPRWGRGQETPGEDPLVVSAYGVEYVRGFQGENGGSVDRRDVFGEKRLLLDQEADHADDGGLMLSACCKHFTAYDLDKWENFSRYSFDAVVSEQDMVDTYQPPFQSCIQEGKASCLMCSYNRVNGVPMCAREDLLQQARTDWGFNGYITSDCGAVEMMKDKQGYVQSPEDAVAVVLKAGMDLDCGAYSLIFTQSAIDQGKVQQQDIDRALFNLFSVQLRLGYFDGNPEKGKFGNLGPRDVCTPEHRKLALEAARQGIVLVKNDDNCLPLNKNRVNSLAVIGPIANDASKYGGGYSGVPCDPKSCFEGLQAYIKKIYYAAGCLDVPCISNDGFEEAVGIARDADFVVVVAGLDSSQEAEDQDRESLLLPGKQMDLIFDVAHVSKRPLILILTGGGPVDVSFAKNDPRIASILWVGYPGEAGGQALAEIIFGEFNPGGRLPMTWYPESFTRVSMTDMSMRADLQCNYPGRTYRFYTGDKVYEFGHGMSYSSYTYEFISVPNKLSLSGSSSIVTSPSNNTRYQRSDGLDYIHIDEVDSCDALKFYAHIKVINNGDMDGSNVVMLFSRPPRIFQGVPQKQLIGFNKVHTESYRATETSILVEPCKHLSVVNGRGMRVLPLGNHILMLEDLEHSISIETY